MSDSEHSSITYTSVPSLVEDYSDIKSPEVDAPLLSDYVHGPEEPEQAPLSPDYVPSPEEPKQAPLLPDYVPGLEEPEQVPPSPVYLPYVPESVYPEYMPPEDNVFPAEEQPLPVAATPTADSPGYIPEFDPKGDLEEDDEEDPKEDPANYHADSTVVALPAVDHVPSEEVTKPLPQIPSPPLPIPSPPLDSPTHIEIPESCLPLWKRLRFASPTPSQEVRESSAAGAARQNEPAIARDDPYSLDELVGASEEIAPTTPQGVNQRVTDLFIVVEQETTIMYGMMEEAQDDRSQLRGRVNLLYRDMPVHRHLAVMIEREARMVREAWGLSMDASDNARSDVMSLRTTLVAQLALILDLHAADHSRQGVIKELLAADHKIKKMAPKRTTRSIPVITTPALETTTLVTNAQLQAMIDQGVTAALAVRDANRNGDDSHTSGTGRPVQVAGECTYPDFLKCQPLNFKGTKEVKGTDVVAYSQRFQELALMCDQMFSEEIDKIKRYVDGLPATILGSGETAALAARDANRNVDDSHTSGTGRPVQVARECTYPDFLKCQPLNFKGTEGVVGLSQWFEKMESVYSISIYTVACQVKFAMCTLQGNAIIW
nr:hypothetical protein [Tanacetum cinerariifolium]